MKTSILIFIGLNLITSLAISQIQIDWQQCYGGSESESARDVVETENGYIIIGSTPSDDGDVTFTHGDGDFWIIWIDSTGNILNDKSYGGSSGEFLFDGFYAKNSNDLFLVGHSGSTDGDITYDPYPGKVNL